MSTSDPTSDIPGGSRLERERQRRRRRVAQLRRASAIVAGVVAVALFALVATDTLGVRGKRPSLTDDAAVAGPSRASALALADSAQLDELDELPPRRPLNPFEPMQLWIAGDSHVGVVGRSLGDIVAPTGVIAARVDYRVSSGLLGGPRDWQEYAPGELAEHDPDTVVFMVGTNDAVVWDDSLADEYRLRVASMMDLLSDNGRRIVLWVGTPPLRDERSNEGALATNEIFRELADERPEVLYVDAHDLFDDGGGGYVDSLTNLEGEFVRMRRDDGIHLTDDGGDHLAAVLYAIIDDIWDVSAQEFPERPIEWVTTSGSGCGGACNGSSAGSGSTGQRSSSEATTPPSTDDPTAGSTVPAETTTVTTGPEVSTTVPTPTTTAAPTTSAPTTTPPSTEAPPTTEAPPDTGDAAASQDQA